MSVMSQADVLRRMEDGYYLIQPIAYSDTEPPYFLVKDEMALSNIAARAGLGRRTEDKELVPRPVAKKIIASGIVERWGKSSNWRCWKPVPKRPPAQSG